MFRALLLAQTLSGSIPHPVPPPQHVVSPPAVSAPQQQQQQRDIWGNAAQSNVWEARK